MMEFGLDEFIELKNRLHNENMQYTKENVLVGDFTYGIPQVKDWGEGATLKIGKFCSIAENVTIFIGGEHRPDWVSTYPFNALLKNFAYIKGHPMTKGNVNIGNDVWIASGVKIMSGVTIGDGAVIGANALITNDVRPYEIVGGVPAKHIRWRFPRRIRRKLLKIKWWNWSDEDILRFIPLIQSDDVKNLLNSFNV